MKPEILAQLLRELGEEPGAWLLLQPLAKLLDAGVGCHGL